MIVQVSAKHTRVSNRTLVIKSLCYTADEHASAPSFKSVQESSSEPASTGKDFQPGSWKP